MALLVGKDPGQRLTGRVQRTSRLVLSIMLTAIVAAGLAAGCAPAVPQTGSVPGPAGALAVVLERGTLVVATDPSYPPQSEYLPDAVRSEPTQCGSDQFTAAEFSGFDIEVAEEIALRLDVEACFVTPAWSQLIAGSWSDLWDINVGSMVITTDRMEKLYFSQPYTSGSAVLFIHSDNQTYHQPSDLSEKKIGVCTGCAYEDYLRGYLEIPGSTVQYKIDRAVPVGFETDTSALAALAKGDGVLVDAVMTDPDTGQAAIDSGLPIKQLKDVLYYDYVAVSVDKKTSRDPVPLVRRITEIIQDMHADGTLVKLSEKYYHGDFSAPAAQYDIQGLDQYD